MFRLRMTTTTWRMAHVFPVGQRIITPDALGFIENICIFAAITLCTGIEYYGEEEIIKKEKTYHIK